MFRTFHFSWFGVSVFPFIFFQRMDTLRSVSSSPSTMTLLLFMDFVLTDFWKDYTSCNSLMSKLSESPSLSLKSFSFDILRETM